MQEYALHIQKEIFHLLIIKSLIVKRVQKEAISKLKFKIYL